MTDKAALLAEAYRRGLLPPQQKAAYEEAQRRGIVPKQPAPAPRTSQGLGFVKGFIDPLARLSASAESALDRTGFPASRLNAMTTIGGRSEQGNRAAFDGYIDRKKSEGVRPGAIGEVAGNVVASVPIMAATRNPYVGGAVSGAFLSKAKDVKGTLVDAAIGGVAGKLGDVAVSKVAGALKGVADPGLKMLRDRGVTLSPGQILGGRAKIAEDKMMSLPLIGGKIAADRARSLETFSNGVVNQALGHIGKSLPKNSAAGHEAVGFAQDAISDAYNSVLPKTSLRGDARLAVGIRAIADEVNNLPAAQAEQVRTLLDRSIRFGRDGKMSGEAFKRTQSEITRLARSYGSSSAAGEREMAAVLRKVDGELRQALARQNPAQAAELNKINRAFAVMARVDDAASRTADGVVSPAQLRMAARRGDSSVRKKASARGDALLQDYAKAGQERLGNTPNSFTADRLNTINPVAWAAGLAARVGYGPSKAVANALASDRPAIVRNAGNALQKASPTAAVVGSTGFSAKKRPK